jgi:DNA-binding NtrC family response regulator
MERVLVVDDEEGIRTFIGEVLEGEGLRVTLASDGEAAARMLDREAFHLMITDLKMPGLDGMTLLRKARTDSPETEVVVLTAHGTVSGAVEAMKLGAFDYLDKPLSGPDELRLVASRAIERRRLACARTPRARIPWMKASRPSWPEIAPCRRCFPKCSGWPRPTPPCFSLVRAGPARRCWRGRCTDRASVPMDRSWP